MRCFFVAGLVRIQCDSVAGFVRTRCDSVAGFVRIRCDSVAGFVRIRCDSVAGFVRIRCDSVAGFVRIRCDSVEGIRILTNPATLNTHHSQYQWRPGVRGMYSSDHYLNRGRSRNRRRSRNSGAAILKQLRFRDDSAPLLSCQNTQFFSGDRIQSLHFGKLPGVSTVDPAGLPASRRVVRSIGLPDGHGSIGSKFRIGCLSIV